jgi:hypothetical protein
MFTFPVLKNGKGSGKVNFLKIKMKNWVVNAEPVFNVVVGVLQPPTRL